ncbi:MAG: hypothetical protein M1816_000421 [Peltula sp. TS41687]|nr:MAG: hypothetical protein M1816_000421 [Peltula sp. TS41687]
MSAFAKASVEAEAWGYGIYSESRKRNPRMTLVPSEILRRRAGSGNSTGGGMVESRKVELEEDRRSLCTMAVHVLSSHWTAYSLSVHCRGCGKKAPRHARDCMERVKWPLPAAGRRTLELHKAVYRGDRAAVKRLLAGGRHPY